MGCDWLGFGLVVLLDVCDMGRCWVCVCEDGDC